MIIFLFLIEPPAPQFELPDSLLPLINEEKIKIYEAETLTITGYYDKLKQEITLKSFNFPFQTIHYNFSFYRDTLFGREFLTAEIKNRMLLKNNIIKSSLSYGYDFNRQKNLFSPSFAFIHSNDNFYGFFIKSWYSIDSINYGTGKIEKGIYLNNTKLSYIFNAGILLQNYKITNEIYKTGFEFSTLKPIDFGIYLNLKDKTPEIFLSIKQNKYFKVYLSLNNETILNPETISFSKTPYQCIKIEQYKKNTIELVFENKNFHAKIYYKNPIILPDDSLNLILSYDLNFFGEISYKITTTYIENYIKMILHYGDKRIPYYEIEDTLKLKYKIFNTGISLKTSGTKYYNEILQPYLLFSPFIGTEYKGFVVQFYIFNVNKTTATLYPSITIDDRFYSIFIRYKYSIPWRIKIKL